MFCVQPCHSDIRRVQPIANARQANVEARIDDGMQPNIQDSLVFVVSHLEFLLFCNDSIGDSSLSLQVLA